MVLTPALIYSQLEALVLPVLREYQSDLTVQDRNCLSAYTEPFLLSYRPTGTNLLVDSCASRVYRVEVSPAEHALYTAHAPRGGDAG